MSDEREDHPWRHPADEQQQLEFAGVKDRMSKLARQTGARRCDACHQPLPADADQYTRRHDDCPAPPLPREFVDAVERLKARTGTR